MASNERTAAAELLDEARYLEALALHVAATIPGPGAGATTWSFRDGIVFAYRSAARRLRSLSAQWDDAGDLDAWYATLGARAICARDRWAAA